jgi:hypothetical protein
MINLRESLLEQIQAHAERSLECADWTGKEQAHQCLVLEAIGGRIPAVVGHKPEVAGITVARKHNRYNLQHRDSLRRKSR